MKKFYVTANACDFGLIEAQDAQAARDAAARMAGYESEADMCATLKNPGDDLVESEIVAVEA